MVAKGGRRGWNGGGNTISSILYPEGSRYLEAGGARGEEGRAGAWEFRDHCICMRGRHMSSLWLEEKSLSRGAASSGYEALEGRQIMAFLTSA